MSTNRTLNMRYVRLPIPNLNNSYYKCVNEWQQWRYDVPTMTETKELPAQ